MGILSTRVLPYLILLAFLFLFLPDFKILLDLSIGKWFQQDIPLLIKSFLSYS